MLLLKKIMAKTLSSVKKRKEEITSFPRVKKGVEPYCSFFKKEYVVIFSYITLISRQN